MVLWYRQWVFCEVRGWICNIIYMNFRFQGLYLSRLSSRKKWIAFCWFVPTAPKSCCESLQPRKTVRVIISCYGIPYYGHRTASSVTDSHFVLQYAGGLIPLMSCQNIFFRTVRPSILLSSVAYENIARVFNPAPSRTTLRGGSHFVSEMWFGFILRNGGRAPASSPLCKITPLNYGTGRRNKQMHFIVLFCVTM
jgi:hypothetical protein